MRGVHQTRLKPPPERFAISRGRRRRPGVHQSVVMETATRGCWYRPRRRVCSSRINASTSGPARGGRGAEGRPKDGPRPQRHRWARYNPEATATSRAAVDAARACATRSSAEGSGLAALREGWASITRSASASPSPASARGMPPSPQSTTIEWMVRFDTWPPGLNKRLPWITNGKVSTSLPSRRISKMNVSSIGAPAPG